MTKARRIRRNRRWLASAAGGLLVGAAGILATTLLLNGGLIGYALAGYAVTLWTFVWGAARMTRILRENPNPLIDEVDCSADEQVVRIGEREIAREKIRSASVVTRRGHAQVEIVTTPSFAPRICLRVASVEAGEALLEELGLGVRHQAATFLTGPPMRASQMMTLLGINVVAAMALMLSTSGPASPLSFLVFLIPLLALLTPQKVVVGADGLRLKWGLRTRFVPYDDIDLVHEEASLNERMLIITRRSGKRLLLPLGSRKTPEYLATLIARIEMARAQHAAGDLAEAAAILDRGDRDHASWVRRLRVLTEVGQHREGAVVEQTLWRILESPASPPLTRAAAAVALEPRIDARDRLRIEDVARSSASTELRRVLEAEEDAALAEALETLEIVSS